MKSYPQIAQIYTDSVEEDKDPDTYRIIGAAIEVHRQLGHGFLERVYHLALMEEFRARDMDFSAEVDLPVYYKAKQLDCNYKADFICMNEVIVELTNEFIYQTTLSLFCQRFWQGAGAPVQSFCIKRRERRQGR